MMAFNVTIHAKILKNLLRCAELELEGKTQKWTTGEYWNKALTFPFLERETYQQREKKNASDFPLPASNEHDQGRGKSIS